LITYFGPQRGMKLRKKYGFDHFSTQFNLQHYHLDNQPMEKKESFPKMICTKKIT